MCEPATLLMAASTAASVGNQAVNASSQRKAIRAGQAREEDQMNRQADQQGRDRTAEARRERARIQALAAQSGARGLTIDTVINDVLFQGSRDRARIESNRRQGVQDSRLNARSRINSVGKPDILGAGLQIASQFAPAGGE